MQLPVLSEKKEVLLLNGIQAMKADLKMGDKKITNLGTPTDGNDIATKGYVDDQIHLQSNKLFDKRTDSYDLHPNFSFYPRGVLGGNIASFQYCVLAVTFSFQRFLF